MTARKDGPRGVAPLRQPDGTQTDSNCDTTESNAGQSIVRGRPSGGQLTSRAEKPDLQTRPRGMTYSSRRIHCLAGLQKDVAGSPHIARSFARVSPVQLRQATPINPKRGQ